MELQPYQQRLLDEYKELTDKASKLSCFLERLRFDPSAPKVSPTERDLLIDQEIAMRRYQKIMFRRLCLMGIDPRA